MQPCVDSLTKTPFKDILDKYDSFFFDCDGVLFNGINYMAPAFEALNKLKELGKNVFFVTNMSKASRVDAHAKISGGGFVPDLDKVFTSSYLAARYLAINHPQVKKAYLIGLNGLKEELELQGISVVGGEEDNGKRMDHILFDEIEPEEDIEAVVAALDYDLNYYKIAYASVLLQKGAVFVATNPDACIKGKKYKMPGGGMVARALEYATGKVPYIVGKPNPVVIDIAKQTFGLDPKRCLMIGDRLDTDILVGQNAGIDTFAVLTGVSSEQDILNEASKKNGIRPTYYWDRVEI